MSRRCRVALLSLSIVVSACLSGTPRAHESERRIAELEKENSELRPRVEALENRLEAMEREREFIGGSLVIDARVTEVHRELKSVVIDRGKQDAVGVGYVF